MMALSDFSNIIWISSSMLTMLESMSRCFNSSMTAWRYCSISFFVGFIIAFYYFVTILFSTILPRWKTACHLQNLPLGFKTGGPSGLRSNLSSCPLGFLPISGVMFTTSTIAVSLTLL